MPYVIAADRCINCGWCRRECPTDTIRFFGQPGGRHWVDPVGCIDCDICARVCPTDCISHSSTPAPDPDLLAAARERARGEYRRRRAFARALDAYARGVVASQGAGVGAAGG